MAVTESRWLSNYLGPDEAFRYVDRLWSDRQEACFASSVGNLATVDHDLTVHAVHPPEGHGTSSFCTVLLRNTKHSAPTGHCVGPLPRASFLRRLRDVMGNPFRPFPTRPVPVRPPPTWSAQPPGSAGSFHSRMLQVWNPYAHPDEEPETEPDVPGSWRTDDVMRMARPLLRDVVGPPGHALRQDTMLVLADALEEAGCLDEDVLRHCRHQERCYSCLGSGHLSRVSVVPRGDDSGRVFDVDRAARCPSCEGTGWRSYAGVTDGPAVDHGLGCWVVELLLHEEIRRSAPYVKPTRRRRKRKASGEGSTGSWAESQW